MLRAEVTWIDAHDDARTWTELDDLDDAVRFITTVGLLAKRDEQHLHMALSWDPETGHVASTIKIPLCCVRTIRYLRPVKGRFWRWGSI
jgi:hypothetical protein